MSNFFRLTKNPRTGELAQATWWGKKGKHKIKFPNGDEFDEDEIKTWQINKK